MPEDRLGDSPEKDICSLGVNHQQLISLKICWVNHLQLISLKMCWVIHLKKLSILLG